MEPKKNYTNINSNSFQSLITQICARSKSLLILLKIGVANSLEDATHRLSNILPMAFRTYSPRPFAHTPARNICGRSKLWCWRHRCTVRGSTSGAVYTSLILVPKHLISWVRRACRIYLLDALPPLPYNPKSSNGRKIARIAPILTIFGQN